MKQLTLSATGFERYAKTTRRGTVFGERKGVGRGRALKMQSEPFYPKAGNARPPVGVERMLRIYFLQQWFNLSDPAAPAQPPSDPRGTQTRACDGDRCRDPHTPTGPSTTTTLMLNEPKCHPSSRSILSPINPLVQPDRGHQASVRFRPSALSRAQKEHPSPGRHLRTRQSVYGAPPAIALLWGVIFFSHRRL